jgi:hypothetical protein
MSTVCGNMRLNGTLNVRKFSRHNRKAVIKWHVKNWIQYRWREIPFYLFLAVLPVLRWFIPAIMVIHSKVSFRVLRADGTIEDLGIVGRHLVVTAGKNYVAGTFNSVGNDNLLKFHGFGTGTTAAAIGDTLLQTEFTTQYAVASTRPTGSQANATNTYTTVATFSPGSGGLLAVTEWGLFSASASGATTLFDHQVFAAVNLNSGSDSLQTTYVLTLS